MQDYPYIFHEYKYDGEEINYIKPPNNANCFMNGFNYMSLELPNKQFILGNTQKFTFTVYKPEVCQTDIMIVTTSFDGYDVLPSFVTIN